MSDRFSIVREDIHRRYGQLFPAEQLDQILADSIAQHEASAKLPDFVPVMVERDVAAQLEELSAGQKVEKRPEVLFVDHRNTGRSQIASALLQHHAGDAIFSRSVGLEPDGRGVNPLVIKVLNDRGINTGALYQKEYVARTVHRSNVVVLLGVDGIPDLPGDRYEKWDIADTAGANEAELNAIVDATEVQIKDLIARLET